MVVLVVISGNELILGMSLIGQSIDWTKKEDWTNIDPCGTPYKLVFDKELSLNVARVSLNTTSLAWHCILKLLCCRRNTFLHFYGFCFGRVLLCPLLLLPS